MSVMIRNVSEADKVDTLTLPTKPDGSFYRFEMLIDNGWSRVYSDSSHELLEHLIPGYSDMSTKDRLVARIVHATTTQTQLQAIINSSYISTERTPDEDAILNGDRREPPEVDIWECDVPLVLVDAYYAPYTERLIPISGYGDVVNPPNIWWLRPAHDPLGYLMSLNRFGVVVLNINAQEAV